MLKKFSKKDFFTIPNYMSIFRLCLIPLIIWLYCFKKSNTAAVAVIAVSAATDIFDGKIARKFNMVTDLGKVLDPIADKLTQAAMIICLTTRYRLMLYMIIIFAAKEMLMLIMGFLVLHYNNTINSAKWYGKACTVILEMIIAVLIVFSDIPQNIANAMIYICCAAVIISLILYAAFYFSLFSKSVRRAILLNAYKIFLCIFLACVLIVCFMNKDKFSVDGVLKYTPENMFLAVVFMLFLFALKSLSIFVYCGILYIADGIIFPLPAAILMNIIGTAVMVSLPYFIGKKIGFEAVEHITEKHPKANILKKIRTDNEFLFVFITHVINILPYDILSLYMGAAGLPYSKYLPACILGMLPSIIAFPIMGKSITDPGSPQFIISAVFEAAFMALSALGYLLYIKRKHKNHKEN